VQGQQEQTKLHERQHLAHGNAHVSRAALLSAAALVRDALPQHGTQGSVASSFASSRSQATAIAPLAAAASPVRVLRSASARRTVRRAAGSGSGSGSGTGVVGGSGSVYDAAEAGVDADADDDDLLDIAQAAWARPRGASNSLLVSGPRLFDTGSFAAASAGFGSGFGSAFASGSGSGAHSNHTFAATSADLYGHSVADVDGRHDDHQLTHRSSSSLYRGDSDPLYGAANAADRLFGRSSRDVVDFRTVGNGNDNGYNIGGSSSTGNSNDYSRRVGRNSSSSSSSLAVRFAPSASERDDDYDSARYAAAADEEEEDEDYDENDDASHAYGSTSGGEWSNGAGSARVSAFNTHLHPSSTSASSSAPSAPASVSLSSSLPRWPPPRLLTAASVLLSSTSSLLSSASDSAEFNSLGGRQHSAPAATALAGAATLSAVPASAPALAPPAAAASIASAGSSAFVPTYTVSSAAAAASFAGVGVGDLMDEVAALRAEIARLRSAGPRAAFADRSSSSSTASSSTASSSYSSSSASSLPASYLSASSFAPPPASGARAAALSVESDAPPRQFAFFPSFEALTGTP
jgi:hypothetical protein